MLHNVIYRYLGLRPQFYYDLLQTLLSRVYNSLEWVNSPPKPHIFIIVVLRSGPGKSEKNGKHWANKTKNIPDLAEQVRQHNDREFNEDYRSCHDYLSDPDVPQSDKETEVQDQISTLKANYWAESEKISRDSSSTAEDSQKLRDKYEHEKESMLRCAKDNNVPLDGVDSSDHHDELAQGALSVHTARQMWDNIRTYFNGDVKAYEKEVEKQLKEDPSKDRSRWINEDVEEAITERNRQEAESVQRQRAANEAQERKTAQEEARRERDADLALQQQCEPMDLWDPDG